ncbi:glycosyltransferase family 2 protein [Calothrix sp. PCC 6303]|uniref:glycosyltransferase family 2 protein n=1 Tax=Calothrix sp. PCC 6303 TaxID=1170562 RepID=UPI0002A058E5|nr:glycosyltransferase family 2 protein [Calothrix sp. PCC 6303]AFY99704.1 glycosyl transferase family 2 [Calothrix sp. PCC 6303]
MNKLLTIAIPTYNCAVTLDEQLGWLANAIAGYESECEVLISDNASQDNTQAVIKKWQENLSNVDFRVNQNLINIGVMKNIAYCLKSTSSKYVWVIGDDETIQTNAVSYVIQNLKAHPDLSLLSLNYSRFDLPNNRIVKGRNFDIAEEELVVDGRTFIENNISENIFGLGFISAQIYQTEVVQLALEIWKSSINNLEGQIYWGAFCALQGSIKFSRDVYLVYTYGTNALANQRLWFRVRYADLPIVYAKLREIGYSRNFCRELIIKHFTTKNNAKMILGAIRRWPVLGVKTVSLYLILVCASIASSILSPKEVKV